MKRVLLCLFVSTNAFAAVEFGASYSNDVEASVQYNFERPDGYTGFPKLSFSLLDKSIGAGAGFRHEMLNVGAMAGFDFVRNKIYGDLDIALMQKEGKTLFGIGVTKRLYFYKKTTESEMIPKLVFGFSI